MYHFYLILNLLFNHIYINNHQSLVISLLHISNYKKSHNNKRVVCNLIEYIHDVKLAKFIFFIKKSFVYCDYLYITIKQ